jgi:hypothetical protein
MTAAALKAARRVATMFDLKAAWAKFSGEFWEGFAAARAKAPIDTPNPFAVLSESEINAMIDAAMRVSYAEGAAQAIAAEFDAMARLRPTESSPHESATLH